MGEGAPNLSFGDRYMAVWENESTHHHHHHHYHHNHPRESALRTRSKFTPSLAQCPNPTPKEKDKPSLTADGNSPKSFPATEHFLKVITFCVNVPVYKQPTKLPLHSKNSLSSYSLPSNLIRSHYHSHLSIKDLAWITCSKCSGLTSPLTRCLL